VPAVLVFHAADLSNPNGIKAFSPVLRAALHWVNVSNDFAIHLMKPRRGFDFYFDDYPA
jgi:hypothetical protein